MRGGKAFWALALATTSASCTYILGLEGVDVESSTSNSSDSSGTTSSMTSAAGGGGNTGGGGGGQGGGGCTNDTCGPVVVDSVELSPDSLVVHADKLYWIAADPDSEVRVVRTAGVEDQGDTATTLLTAGNNANLLDIAIGGDGGSGVRLYGTTGTSLQVGDIGAPGTMTEMHTATDAKAIAADAANLYWIEVGTDPLVVMKAPISGGGPDPFTTADEATNLKDIVSDGTDVYWLDGSRLIRASGSGSSGTLMDQDHTPEKIAVSAMKVCWIQPVIEQGVYCIDKMSGMVSKIASAPMPSAIAMDDVHAYWIEGTQIRRAPLDTQDTLPAGELVAQDNNQPKSIAVDSTRVYWTNNTSVVRRRKPD